MNNQFKAQSLNRKSYRKFTLSYFSVTSFKHVGLLWPITALDRKQEWGLLSQFSPFRYFPTFSEWWKQWLPEWYQVHIWQVSPQLSCGDTWQIWTWLKVSNLYFYRIIISRNGEINERSFSNPHPRCVVTPTSSSDPYLPDVIYILQYNGCVMYSRVAEHVK